MHVFAINYLDKYYLLCGLTCEPLEIVGAAGFFVACCTKIGGASAAGESPLKAAHNLAEMLSSAYDWVNRNRGIGFLPPAGGEPPPSGAPAEVAAIPPAPPVKTRPEGVSVSHDTGGALVPSRYVRRDGNVIYISPTPQELQ